MSVYAFSWPTFQRKRPGRKTFYCGLRWKKVRSKKNLKRKVAEEHKPELKPPLREEVKGFRVLGFRGWGFRGLGV